MFLRFAEENQAEVQKLSFTLAFYLKMLSVLFLTYTIFEIYIYIIFETYIEESFCNN